MKLNIRIFSISLVYFILSTSLFSDDSEIFRNAILEKHNYYRGIAGIKSLEWDTNLEQFAQSWASALKKTRNCDMEHSSSQPRQNIKGFDYVGENLFYSYSSQPFNIEKELKELTKLAVTSWYEEIADFQYSPRGVVCPLRGKRGMIGHFTQVMWESTTSLGCAYSFCNGNKILLVTCNYGPGGNYNQYITPPFSLEAAEKLNAHPENKTFGGLPFCK